MWLIDSNVLSELGRHKPNPAILHWIKVQKTLNISVITMEELLMDAYAIGSDKKIQLYKEIFTLPYYKVLPITHDIALRSAYLRGQFRKTGITRNMADMLIAATAAAHELTVVTRNVRDFLDCGVPIFDPFLE